MIYVVDDEPAVAEMVSEVLRNSGWQVTAFTEPRLALAALAAADPKPRLLLTDFRMPDMDGLELYRRCVALSPELKSIMVTGMMSPAAFDHLSAKPDLLIQKPATAAQLRSAVENILRTGPSTA